jgi:tetratricopeptide (TPR) repeat protein
LYAKIGKSERAVELLREGLTRHPNYAPYHETLGYVLRYAGLMQPSIDSYSEGQKLDASLDNLVSTQDQITKSYIYLLEYDRALASHRRMRSFLERAKRVPDEKQWFYEGVIHLYRGDTVAAVAAFHAGAQRLPNSVWTTFGRAYAAMAQRDRASAAAVLDELERQDIVDGERHYRLVHFAVFAGRTDRALQHLQISVDGGFFNAPYIARDPWLTPLRGLPQFAQILNVARARHEAVQRSLTADSRHPPGRDQ